MTRHNVRCVICNRFITMADRADDDMCLTCAGKIDRIVESRVRPLRRFVFMFAVLMLALVSVAMWTSLASASQQEREYDQFVSGVNLTTGERVVGWVSGDEWVQGRIMDMFGVYEVEGAQDDRGRLYLESEYSLYRVRIVNEVTSDKLENRKQWDD